MNNATTAPALDLNRLYLRIALKPRADLKRGYSYSMGCFGDESQAHAGLSSYSVSWRGLRGAAEALRERMGFEEGFIVVFEGSDAGTGPDGDDLCRPARIVFQIKASKVASVENLLSLLASAGIAETE